MCATHLCTLLHFLERQILILALATQAILLKIEKIKPTARGRPAASHLPFPEEYRQVRRRQKGRASKCIPRDGPNKPDTAKRMAKNATYRNII